MIVFTFNFHLQFTKTNLETHISLTFEKKNQNFFVSYISQNSLEEDKSHGKQRQPLFLARTKQDLEFNHARKKDKKKKTQGIRNLQGLF